MRLSFSTLAFPILAVLALAACGSPASDNVAAQDVTVSGNSVTLELPPPKPFQEPIPSETNNMAEAVEPDLSAGNETAVMPDAVPQKVEPVPAPEEPSTPPETEAEAAPKAEPKADAGSREVRLLPTPVPLPKTEIARTIERIGFKCGEVVSSNRVDNGAGEPIYKVDCSSGSSFQGTTKSGRLFFREWTGRLSKN